MSSEEILKALEDVRLYIPNPDPIGSDDIWVKSDDLLDMVRAYVAGSVPRVEVGIHRNPNNAEDPGNPEKLYYIQNGWEMNGNTMVWWRPNSCGYTLNINQAGKYTKEDALERITREEDIAWECDYVDSCSMGYRVIIGDLNSKYRLEKI